MADGGQGEASERAVEALYDKLAFNESAYGKAWTGELEDCRFLLSGAEEVIREDQTRRIVEWLRRVGIRAALTVDEEKACRAMIDAIASEFSRHTEQGPSDA